MDTIQSTQPRASVLENVSTLLTHDGGRTWDEVKTHLDSLEGYTWSYQVLNTKDYGIPQSRKRLYIVGLKGDIGGRGGYFPPLIRHSL
eukprot:5646718-Prymnesium_polylepis.1